MSSESKQKLYMTGQKNNLVECQLDFIKVKAKLYMTGKQRQSSRLPIRCRWNQNQSLTIFGNRRQSSNINMLYIAKITPKLSKK